MDLPGLVVLLLMMMAQAVVNDVILALRIDSNDMTSMGKQMFEGRQRLHGVEVGVGHVLTCKAYRLVGNTSEERDEQDTPL